MAHHELHRWPSTVSTAPTKSSFDSLIHIPSSRSKNNYGKLSKMKKKKDSEFHMRHLPTRLNQYSIQSTAWLLQALCACAHFRPDSKPPKLQGQQASTAGRRGDALPSVSMQHLTNHSSQVTSAAGSEAYGRLSEAQ